MKRAVGKQGKAAAPMPAAGVRQGRVTVESQRSHEARWEFHDTPAEVARNMAMTGNEPRSLATAQRASLTVDVEGQGEAEFFSLVFRRQRFRVTGEWDRKEQADFDLSFDRRELMAFFAAMRAVEQACFGRHS